MDRATNSYSLCTQLYTVHNLFTLFFPFALPSLLYFMIERKAWYGVRKLESKRERPKEKCIAKSENAIELVIEWKGMNTIGCCEGWFLCHVPCNANIYMFMLLFYTIQICHFHRTNSMYALDLCIFHSSFPSFHGIGHTFCLCSLHMNIFLLFLSHNFQ